MPVPVSLFTNLPYTGCSILLALVSNCPSAPSKTTKALANAIQLPSSPADLAPTLLHPSVDYPVMVYTALRVTLFSSHTYRSGQFCTRQEEEETAQDCSSAPGPHREEVNTGLWRSKDLAFAKLPPLLR